MNNAMEFRSKKAGREKYNMLSTSIYVRRNLLPFVQIDLEITIFGVSFTEKEERKILNNKDERSISEYF